MIEKALSHSINDDDGQEEASQILCITINDMHYLTHFFESKLIFHADKREGGKEVRIHTMKNRRFHLCPLNKSSRRNSKNAD